MRRMLCIILTAVLVLSLLGCASHPELNSVEDFFNFTVQNMDEVKSVDLTTSVSIDYRLDGEKKTARFKTDVSQFIDPIELSVASASNIDGEINNSRQILKTLNLDDAQVPMRVTFVQETNGKWQADQDPAMDVFSGGKALYTQDNLKLFSNQVKNFSYDGTNVYYGLNVGVVKGSVSGNPMRKIIENTDVLSRYKNIVLAPDKRSEQWNSSWEKAWANIVMQPQISIDVELYFQDQKLLPMRYYIDMTGAIDALVKEHAALINNSGDFPSVSLCTYELSLRNYDQATEIELPEEAMEAWRNRQSDKDEHAQ